MSSEMHLLLVVSSRIGEMVPLLLLQGMQRRCRLLLMHTNSTFLLAAHRLPLNSEHVENLQRSEKPPEPRVQNEITINTHNIACSS